MKHVSGAAAVYVRDIPGAVGWYTEKLELKESGNPVCDGEPGDTELVSRNGDIIISVCGREGREPDSSIPILDTSNASKAREWLLSRGVNVSPVETDI